MSDEPRNEALGPRLGSYTKGIRAQKVIGQIQGVRLKVPWSQTQALTVAGWIIIGSAMFPVWLRLGNPVGPILGLLFVLVPAVALAALLWRKEIEGRQPGQWATGVVTLGARRPRSLVGTPPNRRPQTISFSIAVAAGPADTDTDEMPADEEGTS